jgi:ABC-type amino acid transport substrate-binding protein
MLLHKLGLGLMGLLLASQVAAQVSRFSLVEKNWLDDRKNIKVGMVEMTAPILFYRGGQTMGLAADYLRALTAKLGLNLDIVKYRTPDDLMQALRKGNVDLIGAMVHTTSSPHDIHFSRPYLSLPAALYAKGKITGQGLRGLEGLKVSVLEGSIWEEVLPHYMPGLATISYANLDLALQSVLDGQTQVYLGDAASVDYLLKDGRYKGLWAGQQLDLTLDVALATHASSPALHSLMQKAMDRLSEDEIHEIWNNWPGVERPIPYQSNFLVFLLWGLLLVAWSLLLVWIVNKRSKHGLEHHRSKTRRSIKRLRHREDLLKHKVMHIKYKTKRYRNRAKTLRQQIEFMNEVLPSASWSWDSETGECIWEDDMFALVGLDSETFKPSVEAFLELVQEPERELLRSMFNKSNTASDKISYRVQLPDGTETHLLQYSHYIGNDESGARRVCLCWCVNGYYETVRRQHLSIVHSVTPVAEEEAGE